MNYPKKLKSSTIAAISTLLIHLLLFGLLNRNFSGEESSQLSNTELDDLQLLMEDMVPEDIQITPPGKDPLTQQKDKASESISKEKGQVKTTPSKPNPAPIDEERQPLMAEDTIIKKIEVVEKLKIDTPKTVLKDSVTAAEILNKTQPTTTRKYTVKQQSQKDKDKYQYYLKNYKNIRNFRKVYPYALKTKALIDSLNYQLSTMTSESEKKTLIKETEKKLFQQYESAVRTMSTSQGRLLLKLIARETNKTGYEIIKDYRGALPATFWYGVGKIFGTDLKSEFNKEKEDSVIENIVSKYKNDDLY
jgi:hypothetical protein